MADGPEHLAESAGTQPADEDWSSFATVPLDKIGEALDFVLWEMPAHMIPAPERACKFMAELMAREDAGHPAVVAAIAEVLRFLDLDGATRH